MSKKIIRINENDLNKIIEKNIKKFIKEYRLLAQTESRVNDYVVIEYDMRNNEDKAFIKRNIEIIWDILTKGYEKIGGFKGFEYKQDLLKKASVVKLGFLNGDIVAVNVFNGYLGGNKSVGITCVKDERHDRSISLVKFMVDHNIHDINNYYWTEASGKIEELYKEHGRFQIDAETAQELFLTQKVNIIDQYHYERTIKGKKEIKTIFGFKDKHVLDQIKEKNNNDIMAFLNNLEERPELRIKIKEDVDKYSFNTKISVAKNVIDYIISLHEDYLYNEFSDEILSKLYYHISILQMAFNKNMFKDRLEHVYNRERIQKALNIYKTCKSEKVYTLSDVDQYQVKY